MADENDMVESDDDFDDDDLIPDEDDDLEPSDDESDDENNITTLEKDMEDVDIDAESNSDSDFDSIHGDDSEEDSEDEETTSKKIKGGAIDLKNLEVNDFTSRLMTFSPQEVTAKCIITRNKYGTPCDENHQTSPFMTEFEFTAAIGTRASQINEPNSRIFINVPNGMIDGIDIAKEELRQGKSPLVFKREFTDGTCEFWRVTDLLLGKRNL